MSDCQIIPSLKVNLTKKQTKSMLQKSRATAALMMQMRQSVCEPWEKNQAQYSYIQRGVS